MTPSSVMDSVFVNGPEVGDGVGAVPRGTISKAVVVKGTVSAGTAAMKRAKKKNIIQCLVHKKEGKE